jgi:hypothetical protein
MWILSSNLNDEKFNVHLAYDTALQKLLDVKLAFVQYYETHVSICLCGSDVI